MQRLHWLFFILSVLPLRCSAFPECSSGNLITDGDFETTDIPTFNSLWNQDLGDVTLSNGSPGVLYDYGGTHGYVLELPSIPGNIFAEVGQDIASANCPPGTTFYISLDVLWSGPPAEEDFEFSFADRKTYYDTFATRQKFSCYGGWTRYVSTIVTAGSGPIGIFRIYYGSKTAASTDSAGNVFVDNVYFSTTPPSTCPPPAQSSTTSSLASTCDSSPYFTKTIYQSKVPVTTLCSIPPWMYQYHLAQTTPVSLGGESQAQAP